MTEEKKLVGILKGAIAGKQGKKKDGTDYQVWKYTIEINGKELFCSGFVDPFNPNLVTKNVEVTYTESPNPKNMEHPFKNVLNIVEAGVVEEADKKYNMNTFVGEDMAKLKVPQSVWVEKDKNIEFQVAFKGAIELSKAEVAKHSAIDMEAQLKRTLEMTKMLYKGIKEKKLQLKEEGEW